MNCWQYQSKFQAACIRIVKEQCHSPTCFNILSTLGGNIGFAGMLHSVVKHGSRSAWQPIQRRLHTTDCHKDTKERNSDGSCTRSTHFSTLLTCSPRNISELGLSYICLWPHVWPQIDISSTCIHFANVLGIADFHQLPYLPPSSKTRYTLHVRISCHRDSAWSITYTSCWTARWRWERKRWAPFSPIAGVAVRECRGSSLTLVWGRKAGI